MLNLIAALGILAILGGFTLTPIVFFTNIKMPQKDKILHYIVSLSLTLLPLLFFELPKAIWIGVLFSFTIGCLKEFIWDKMLHRGQFELKDLFANILGIVTAVGVLLIITIFM